jgi:hypothetical protein
MENPIILAEDTLMSETDPQGRIIFANDNFCRVSKYELDELLGQPLCVDAVANGIAVSQGVRRAVEQLFDIPVRVHNLMQFDQDIAELVGFEIDPVGFQFFTQQHLAPS